MTSPTEQARAEAEKLLRETLGHPPFPPTIGAVAQALAATRDAEWNKALAECRLIVRRHQRDFPVYLRGELEDAINALRRPDPALNNPEILNMPWEDMSKNVYNIDTSGLSVEAADISPTIEQLRAKVVEARAQQEQLDQPNWISGEARATFYREIAIEQLDWFLANGLTFQTKERDLG